LVAGGFEPSTSYAEVEPVHRELRMLYADDMLRRLVAGSRG